MFDSLSLSLVCFVAFAAGNNPAAAPSALASLRFEFHCPPHLDFSRSLHSPIAKILPARPVPTADGDGNKNGNLGFLLLQLGVFSQDLSLQATLVSEDKIFLVQEP